MQYININGHFRYQVPKLEVLYHNKPYWRHILASAMYPLKFSPYIGLIYCTHLQFSYLKWQRPSCWLEVHSMWGMVVPQS